MFFTNCFPLREAAALAGAGTQNAGLAFGGFSPYGPSTCTEEYDGSTWTAGGNLIVSRFASAGAGTQNAGLAIGGFTPAGSSVEEYNGSIWTTGGNLITAMGYLGGVGTQNEALAFGGFSQVGPTIRLSCTEEYNGTSWIAGGTMACARTDLGGAGTQNAALAFGGSSQTPITQFSTERYDGTSWVNGNNLITYRFSLAGVGTQNTALAVGGGFSGVLTCTEEYNSPSLFAVGNFTSVSGSTRNRIALLNALTGDLISTSSFNIGSAGFNAAANSIAVLPDNSIVAVGAFTAYSGSNINRIVKINTDGTLDTAFSASIGAGLNNTGSVVVNYPSSGVDVWTAGGALITAREVAAGTGTQDAALTAGGGPGVPAGNLAEEYNGSTWSSGGNLITSRYWLVGMGTQNAALVAGGLLVGPNTATGISEEYNGSTWASGGTMATARALMGRAGIQNAALVMGGGIGAPAPACINNTEEYDGSTWTAGGNLIVARQYLNGDGTQNAAVAFGGFVSVAVSCTEEYDGTSWATGGTLITARNSLAGAGTQNAALAVGGGDAISPSLSCTEEYDGSTWTAGGALITGRIQLAGAGTQDAGLAFGGGTPTIVSCTEEYNSPEDKLLLGGTFTQFSGSTFSGSVRLSLSGSRDTTFNIGSGFGAAVDVEDYYIHSDDDIIAVGGFTTYSASFSPQPNRIIKLNSNGSVDAAGIGNTWSKISERSSNDAAGAGSTLALFYLTASYDIPAGTAITASFTASITAKAATGWRFVTDQRAIAYTGSVTSSAAGGTSQPLRINLANLTSGSGNYLFIRGVAFENTNTTTFTPTANYTTISADGTTGGAVITNQSVRGEFRILTTASYFSNPTLGAASSQASIFWTFYESAAAARGRTYFILLD